MEVRHLEDLMAGTITHPAWLAPGAEVTSVRHAGSWRVGFHRRTVVRQSGKSVFVTDGQVETRYLLQGGRYAATPPFLGYVDVLEPVDTPRVLRLHA